MVFINITLLLQLIEILFPRGREDINRNWSPILRTPEPVVFGMQLDTGGSF